MSCGVGHRHGSDLGLLWHRPVAVLPIRPLAWELPYATGAAIKNKLKLKLKNKEIGVPLMAQWKQIQLRTMRLQVQSLALLSGSRIWCCCELWCRSQMWLGSGIAVAVV